MTPALVVQAKNIKNAMELNLNFMHLSQFLVKAKINTYATEGEGGEKVLKDGSKELTFEESNYKYRDRYYGFNPFIGEEIVWHNDKFIWGMNYYGKIMNPDIEARQIYEFLKKCLSQVREDKPYRGPANFKFGDFEYFNDVMGEISQFQGNEKILYQGGIVYELLYQGGFIK